MRKSCDIRIFIRAFKMISLDYQEIYNVTLIQFTWNLYSRFIPPKENVIIILIYVLHDRILISVYYTRKYRFVGVCLYLKGKKNEEAKHWAHNFSWFISYVLKFQRENGKNYCQNIMRSEIHVDQLKKYWIFSSPPTPHWENISDDHIFLTIFQWIRVHWWVIYVPFSLFFFFFES